MQEQAGSLIKSGRFQQAIPLAISDLQSALGRGVISETEFFTLMWKFCTVLYNPSNVADVTACGNDFLELSIRLGNLPTSD